MKDPCKLLMLCVITWLAAGKSLWAADDVPPQENRCIECHGARDLWEGETLHLLVTLENIAADIHWQKGIRCVDCHGGNPNTVELREAHAIEDGFRKVETPADIPGFCGHCHANAQYMQGFQPTAHGSGGSLLGERPRTGSQESPGHCGTPGGHLHFLPSRACHAIGYAPAVLNTSIHVARDLWGLPPPGTH